MAEIFLVVALLLANLAGSANGEFGIISEDSYNIGDNIKIGTYGPGGYMSFIRITKDFKVNEYRTREVEFIGEEGEYLIEVLFVAEGKSEIISKKISVGRPAEGIAEETAEEPVMETSPESLGLLETDKKEYEEDEVVHIKAVLD